jgi:glycosyltransferase involved in cell wall biosynthesis
MRIALLSDVYPPQSSHGIARQRQVLALALRRLGHDVTVVALGPRDESSLTDGVRVRRLAVDRVLPYAPSCPLVDPLLTRSQALYEALAAECPDAEVIDAPLWNLQGFVTVERARCPVVLWLQTTSAQLAALRGGAATSAEKTTHRLEQHLLAQALAWLADSRSVLDSVRDDYGVPVRRLSDIVHLGLAPLAGAPVEDKGHPWVEALIVGRLEQRKGTRLLLECLPALLRRHANLVVRLVGQDNSHADHWQTMTGTDYPTALRRACAEFADRLIIEGHVDDDRVEACYRQADLVIVPSLYESFGLVYLEAMRAGVPVVTFAAGAAGEIFARGEADGAILAPPKQADRLAAAASELIDHAERRRAAGLAGLRRFSEAFTDERLAERTAAFYARVIEAAPGGRARLHVPAGRIYQVAEALESGDGVGNIVRCNAAILSEMQQPRAVLGRFCTPGLESELRGMDDAFNPTTAGLLFHYWGFNGLAWMLHAFRGRLAVHYHNVTPPSHWPAGSAGHRQSTRGYAQLTRLADLFDLVVGDSRYNLRDYERFLTMPKPGLVLHPVIERAELDAAEVDHALLSALDDPTTVNLVFVGRVARNKRQDRLMRMFDYYWRHINRHARLWLVGNADADPSYTAELVALRGTLPGGDRITLTGKVSDAQVQAYYRAADVFVCASEHEGFCMPVAHAMALDVPVIALGRAAVTETLGTGYALANWDVARVAELVHLMAADPAVRGRCLDRQRDSVRRFSRAEARARLQAIVAFLTTGERSPLFEELTPPAGGVSSIMSA